VDNDANVISPLARDGSPAAGLPVRIIVPPGAAPDTSSNPTGIVLNPYKHLFKGATFIVVGEGGTISSWTPKKPDTTTTRVDNSVAGAVYKGVTIASPDCGRTARLYVANFHSGFVEVYDSNFAAIPDASFTDPSIIPTSDPTVAQFAPFNLLTVKRNKESGGDAIVVSFALQNLPDKHDDVAGNGLGLLNLFAPNGKLVRRLVTGNFLNSPWGLTLSDQILYVGNFGNGYINALDASSFVGSSVKEEREEREGKEEKEEKEKKEIKAQALLGINGAQISIDGLWGLLAVGSRLFFAAGLNDESHGLFGRIKPLSH